MKIQEFVKTCQQDLGQICNFVVGKPSRDAEQRRKTGYAAARVLSACFMVAAVVKVLTAVTLLPLSVSGAVGLAAWGVGSFVLAHDIFVILKNKSANKDIVQERTIMRPLWNAFFDKKEEITKKDQAQKA